MNNPARELLLKAQGKYHERRKILTAISLMIAKLEEDDGNFTVKLRILNTLANKVMGPTSLSAGERAEICRQLEGTIQLVFDIGDATDLEMVYQIFQAKKDELGILDDVQALIS